MKEQLETLIRDHPKHYGNLLKKHPDLYAWVTSHYGASIAEQAYNALHPNETICCNGKAKKFNTVFSGYKFCGHANVCHCAKDSVARKVSTAKSNQTQEQKTETNAKRATTNLERYGVVNAGQTAEAKAAHRAVYQDSWRVKEITENIKKTTMSRYGAENVGLLDAVKKKREKTLLKKYGVTNAMLDRATVEKAQQTKKERYEPYHLAKLNYRRFIKTSEENFGVTPLLSHDEYVGVATRPLITFKCCQCGLTFAKRFDYAVPPICKRCNPAEISYKSKEELEVFEFCKSLVPGAISGDRSQINPYEIDIYLPEHKIGIEYCGLYWHSEVSGGKSWNYHYRKFKAAAEKGIQLITIYSDEWNNKKEVVKELARTKIGMANKSTFARKCELITVPSSVANEFYHNTHLQDPPKKLPINYGLMFDGKLCAVMSFFRKNNNSYELTRFATEGRVVGAASKLLQAFVRDCQPEEITSFSNNRYSDGNLYKTLGFVEIGEVPPMQEYVFGYASRLHKRGIGKHIAESKGGKSEWQAARDIGCDRIWDCGKKKWALYPNSKSKQRA
jgi:hypothetical protein